eukprot:snap_masked-scaffold_17-processed-gene-1.32-mRNA-1 protein AED:0.07 eAED:0.07 QI:0/-1/0/1/-1/1/1/0/393
MGRNFIPLNISTFYFLQSNSSKSKLSSATTASNNLSIPTHTISTDIQGRVSSVSQSFLDFTGYKETSFLGKSCNFLQGKDTSKSDVIEIRLAMQRKQSVCVIILNYCKNRNPFWNILTISPTFNNGKISGFYSTIISLKIPPTLSNKPKLCVQDALALINVFSSVPKQVNIKQKQLSSKIYPVKEFEHPKYDKYIFISETLLPTSTGNFRVRAYRDELTKLEPIVLLNINSKLPSLNKEITVRVHDQCLTSEVFGSLKCDCKQQLEYAMKYTEEKEDGVVIYLPQEGRGIGLANKIAAYGLQERGIDTVDANRILGLPDDARRYEAVKDILEDLGVNRIKLMTNNPRKIKCLEKLGVKVSERVECIIPEEELSSFSLRYVKSKEKRMGHMFRH